MTGREQDRYEILRALVTAGARNEKLEKTGRTALQQAARLIGLAAVALYLWDDQNQLSLQLVHSDSDGEAARLAELEAELFLGLRRERQLISAYMSFGGAEPCHSFTLPLRLGERVFGAVIGLQHGDRTIVSEDDFLDALTATIALHAVAGGAAGILPQDIIDQERLTAITETAVTVNHEINNPLTAILGNVQLLLLHREDLDDDLRNKLTVIEESASKIKDVTQRLLRLTSARATDYASGVSMIDLSESEASEDKSDS